MQCLEISNECVLNLFMIILDSLLMDYGDISLTLVYAARIRNACTLSGTFDDETASGCCRKFLWLALIVRDLKFVRARVMRHP